MSWVRSDKGYEAMRKVCQRAHKMTGTKWSKCLNFRRQVTEDAKLKGCDDDNIAKLTGHKTNVFKINYSTALPQLCLHTRSRNMTNEAYYTMGWHM